jgi:DNA-binding NtrC family response regulator
MTAHGTRELTERAMTRGAFPVVSKPFELTELARLVTRAREAASA